MRRHLLVVLAGVVVGSFVGVAQSGELTSAAEYDAAMKEIGATFRAVRSDMEAREGEALIAGTTKLADLFEQVQAFWESHNVTAAAAIATEAGEAASAIRSAVESQAFQEIAPARDTLAGTCQACHNEYREPVDGGRVPDQAGRAVGLVSGRVTSLGAAQDFHHRLLGPPSTHREEPQRFARQPAIARSPLLIPESLALLRQSP